MPKFKLIREFSGYARGVDTVEVEAETLEQALEMVNESMEPLDFKREIRRDDIETEDWDETT